MRAWQNRAWEGANLLTAVGYILEEVCHPTKGPKSGILLARRNNHSIRMGLTRSPWFVFTAIRPSSEKYEVLLDNVVVILAGEDICIEFPKSVDQAVSAYVQAIVKYADRFDSEMFFEAYREAKALDEEFERRNM